jgi:hypothetical protein
MLNVVLSVKEDAEKQWLICLKTYQRERKEIQLEIYQPTVIASGADCLESILLMQWRLGLISRKEKNYTLY